MKVGTVIVALCFISVGCACNCGWMNKGRIVGGQEARKNAYPFVAVLVTGNLFPFCGGTIITEWHVLTAAHCTMHGLQRKVRVGVNDLSTSEGDTYDIARVIHHYFNPYTLADDISIIVTKTKIRFNQNVGPACMPTGWMNLTGEYVKILGWGFTEHGGKASPKLREVDLRVIPLKECQQAWIPLKYHLREFAQMCTYEKGQSACKGDSGGPLVHMNPKTRRFTLAGLVSFGDKCGGPIPRVSTDVSGYVQWIAEEIADVKDAALCSSG